MIRIERLAPTALWVVLMFITALPVFAQQEEKEDSIEVTEFETIQPGQDFFSQNFARIDRTVSQPLARTIRRGAMMFIVDHRTRQAMDKESFRDFLGLDAGGLKVGLGLRYGLLDNLEIGIYRLNGVAEIFDVYDYDLKYALVQQNQHGLNLAFRVGGSWFAQPEQEDASGFIGQLLADRTFFGRLTLGAGVLYHSESSNEEKNDRDDQYSVAIPVQAELRLNSRVALDLETASTVAGYHSRYPAVTAAIKMITQRHTFSIVAGNHRQISADGAAANSPRGFGDMIIGFTITREFNL